jgi:hypothetical protein
MRTLWPLLTFASRLGEVGLPSASPMRSIKGWTASPMLWAADHLLNASSVRPKKSNLTSSPKHHTLRLRASLHLLLHNDK